jgi:hypothetical protein
MFREVLIYSFRMRETGSDTENKRIGCFKAIALPAKNQTTGLEPAQGTAGSFWSEQRSKRLLTPLSDPDPFVRLLWYSKENNSSKAPTNQRRRLE